MKPRYATDMFYLNSIQQLIHFTEQLDIMTLNLGSRFRLGFKDAGFDLGKFFLRLHLHPNSRWLFCDEIWWEKDLLVRDQHDGRLDAVDADAGEDPHISADRSPGPLGSVGGSVISIDTCNLVRTLRNYSEKGQT